jgi:SAM-dependent methyltransferase
MPTQMCLDPETEKRVELRLVEHFTRLGYFNVEQAAGWSLSLGGALVRFHPLLPLLGVEVGEAGESPNGAENGLRDLRLLISGMGSGSEMISARNFGFGQIHGTEVDPFYVSLVAERLAGLPGFFPTAVGGGAIPFEDKSFDVVVSGHIVEHTENPALYVSEHLRVLKPGGFLLLEFPTRFHTRELHTNLPSIEWMPDRLRTAILASIAYKRGLATWGFSDDTRKRCRAITDTGLKQVSLGRVRRWARASGVATTVVGKGRPGPGVVYGILRRDS